MKKSGFTLIEILVTMMVVGALVAVALPFFNNNMRQMKDQSAKNILSAISAAQQKFYEDYNSYCSSHSPVISPCYCVKTGTNPTGATALCGDSAPDLSVNLKLVGMSQSDPFYASYSCSASGTYYTCSATYGADTVTLTAASTGATVTCAGTYCPP